MTPFRSLLMLLLAASLTACPVGGDDDDLVGNDDDAGLPGTYSFASRLGDGSDSVAYSGQVFRHVLIADMKTRISGMTDRLDSGWAPTEGDVADEMAFYFDFDSASSGSIAHNVSTDPAALQTTYDDISADKDLAGKIAGNDAVGQHADWSSDFVGWTGDGVTNPESLARFWFDQLDAQAVAWGQGTYPKDPAGNNVSAVYVTEDGTDLAQLIQKFLLGAVAFSQGADDYLDEDTPDKGLRSDHDAVADGKNYTALEHQWDEGVGYFGLTRNYGEWTDVDIADSGALDTWEVDGAIDLNTEKVFGHASNAAKRDRCADCSAPTDFTRDALEGFLQGRAYISSKSEDLSEDELAELLVYRDRALGAWEKAVAATVVHYINDTIEDLDTWQTAPDAEAFADLAKHWSEMTGFALGLQFNRRSPVTDGQFETLHGLLGQAPDLDDFAGYTGALLAARDLLEEAYGFDAGNVDVW